MDAQQAEKILTGPREESTAALRGEALAAVAAAEGVSMAAVAERLGVGRNTLRSWRVAARRKSGRVAARRKSGRPVAEPDAGWDAAVAAAVAGVTEEQLRLARRAVEAVRRA